MAGVLLDMTAWNHIRTMTAIAAPVLMLVGLRYR
jgi:uncharacterized membrane protein